MKHPENLKGPAFPGPTDTAHGSRGPLGLAQNPVGEPSRRSVTPRAKADRPETLEQALVWQKNLSNYKSHGLCHKCASQAAWGHQIGWTRLQHPPCEQCTSTVADLPRQTANPAWRASRCRGGA